MLTNFLNFWILARLMQAGVTAGLCLVGLGVGFRIARRWQDGASSEQQLTLEQQAELVATVMQVALVLAIFGLGLAVAVADHLAGMGLGVIEVHRRRLIDTVAVSAMQKTLGRWSALGWAGAVVFGVYPVVRYWLHSGGVSVFGEL